MLTRALRHSQQLGLLSVAALLPSDVNVRIIDEDVEPVDLDARESLVGITCMTPQAPRAYALADAFRAKGKTVILGGYHPTFMPAEASQHADAVCIGEAENSVPRMIEDLRAGQLKRIYRGARADLGTLPTLDRRLIRRKAYIADAIQASRGCPHCCSYCSDSAFFGRTHRTRPLESVLGEVEQLGRHLLFLDSNIVGDADYARKLFAGIRGLAKTWVSQCSIEIADDEELLRRAAESGCKGLYIGLETLSQDGLASVSKGFAEAGRYEEQIKRIHDKGIAVFAGLTFGMESHGTDVFDRALQFLYRTKIEAVNPFILTPFPGTRLYDVMHRQGRIFESEWRRYDFSHVVFKPKRMKPEELQAGREFVLREFYSMRKMLRRFVDSLRLGFGVTLGGVVPANLACWYGARKARWSDKLGTAGCPVERSGDELRTE